MRYALVGAGSVGKSFLADLPHLSRELGPVAGGSFRLASRIANTLGAGFAVRNMDALDSSRVILICAGGGAISGLVGDLSRAVISWPRKTLLLCDSNLFSDSLPEFHLRGAFTGSINALGGSRERFVVEGDRPAVLGAKHLARELKVPSLELNREKVATYGAALMFSSSLFTPLLDSCIKCLREAGVGGATAGSVTELLFQRTLRAYLHAGKKSWPGALAGGDQEAIRKQLGALQASEPIMAEYYRMSAVFALELFGAHPELARSLRASALRS